MYTHFQQIIRHRCVRAFQTRRGCAYGTHAPAKLSRAARNPQFTQSFPDPHSHPFPDPHSHPDPHRPRRSCRSARAAPAHTKKPHLKWDAAS